MNRFLLDTHSLIWFFEGDAQLSFKARKIIDDEESTKFISIVSAWEMTIKQKTSSEIKRREDISIFPHCHFKVKQPYDVSS